MISKGSDVSKPWRCSQYIAEGRLVNDSKNFGACAVDTLSGCFNASRRAVFSFVKRLRVAFGVPPFEVVFALKP